MASLKTVLLDIGKDELLNPDIVVTPTSFKLTSQDNNIKKNSTSEDFESIDYWISKPITTYMMVDEDTVEFSCVIEAGEATSDTKEIYLFLENNKPFLYGVFSEPIPKENRQVINIQFKLTNAKNINFEFIKIDKFEEGLLSLNILLTLGNQITKNTTILQQLYIPDVLDSHDMTPITSETFSL